VRRPPSPEAFRAAAQAAREAEAALRAWDGKLTSRLKPDEERRYERERLTAAQSAEELFELARTWPNEAAAVLAADLRGIQR
jgi:hypothetical protein